MPVEVVLGAVVTAGRLRVGVPHGVLDVLQGSAACQQFGCEAVPQAVRAQGVSWLCCVCGGGANSSSIRYEHIAVVWRRATTQRRMDLLGELQLLALLLPSGHDPADADRAEVVALRAANWELITEISIDPAGPSRQVLSRCSSDLTGPRFDVIEHEQAADRPGAVDDT